MLPENPTKLPSKPWTCKVCGHENKGKHFHCQRCDHRPGEGQHDGRAFTPPEED